MAKMIRNAVALFTTMLVNRAVGAVGSAETNSTGPVAALNRKKPGINETTAEKARAAKGRRRQSATGVARTLTSMQATSAPVAAVVLAMEISAQGAGCGSMPIAIGNGSSRHGIEKKVPKEATGHPAAITSVINGTGGDASAITRFAPTAVDPNRHAESEPKALGSGNRAFGGLAVRKQQVGRQRGRPHSRPARQRPGIRCFPFQIGQLRCAVQ
jgi:hypothetical protein